MTLNVYLRELDRALGRSRRLNENQTKWAAAWTLESSAVARKIWMILEVYLKQLAFALNEEVAAMRELVFAYNVSKGRAATGGRARQRRARSI